MANEVAASKNSGVHKWYAVALMRLKEVNKKDKYLNHAADDILKHLQKAIEIDAKDPVAWHFLGKFFYLKIVFYKC